MITLDLKSRFRNKTFILSMVGAIVLLIQQLGFKDLIPSNYADIVNSVLSILVMLGIVVDTSTPGINDQVVADATVQAVNATNTQEEVKTESSTISINSTVTQNSARSKIAVDNPENVQEIGAVVNPISASTPR
ncbi:putative membrane protein [Clostridium beijerinckii]|uniref:phage holin n=1 Tax=Clostridium beijerinckii TaxID=1520 RepID=UPI00149404AE|nr:phage holin [Clostridium beijerinckii]NOW85909.1 putative membrane protein [Clostridium beijerinckii]